MEAGLRKKTKVLLRERRNNKLKFIWLIAG